MLLHDRHNLPAMHVEIMSQTAAGKDYSLLNCFNTCRYKLMYYWLKRYKFKRLHANE